MKRRQHVIRRRYNTTAKGYDELYMNEQLEKYAVTLPKIKPGKRMLDAGCGTALLAEYLEATGLGKDIALSICLDLSPNMLSIAHERLRRLGKQRYEIVEGDLENLPFRDSCLDTAYAFTVMDLLENPLRGVKEMKRVSRGPVVFTLLKKASTARKALPLGKYLGETDKDLILCLSKQTGELGGKS